MAIDKKDNRKLINKLRNKYRLVILNDDTFEEKLSFKLSRLNVFLVAGLLAILLIAGTTILIAFTPLREYIPGYSSTALKRQAYQLSLTTDSLEQQLSYNKLYLANIKNILEGKPPINYNDTIAVDSLLNEDPNMQVSKEDSLLRVLVEEEERFNLPSGPGSELKLGNLNLFTPLKGLVTNGFNLNEAHYGVDIVAKENEVIKAAQNGTVIFAEWTAETGNVIIIQHDNKFISAYKHNSALLKQQGEEVKSGEPIAIIGNSGVLSSGPHLHFELWYDGFPVNPESYILF